jgi:hypothetical protein
MTRSLRPSGKRAIAGLERILLGVTTKLLIADRMAVLADSVFEHPHFFSPLTVASVWSLIPYRSTVISPVLGYCHRRFENYRLRRSRELQYASFVRIDHGVLAPLAHDTVKVAA